MALTGMATVIKNMTAEMQRVQERTRGGMHRAVLTVKRASMKQTPVDTGNLMHSHDTEVFSQGMTIIGEIRVTADYAVYVHEMPESYNFRRPGSGPKFLEKALYENQQKVIDILARAGRIR